MSKVSMKTSVDAPVAKVWQTVGGFNALPNWHPAVEQSDLESGGKRRRLKLAGGGERYRIRQGAYRVVYSVDDDRRVVEVVKIGHRREVYR